MTCQRSPLLPRWSQCGRNWIAPVCNETAIPTVPTGWPRPWDEPDPLTGPRMLVMAALLCVPWLVFWLIVWRLFL